MSFRIARERRVATAGFLAVDELEVMTPDGDVMTRVVVRHPGAVVVVPVEGDNRTALLVRQYRVAADRVLLEVPAGKRDVDGEPPEATGARELEEEMGLRAGRMVALAEFYNTPGFSDEYTYLYLATELQHLDARATTSPEELHMTTERIGLDDVEQLIASRELCDAKSIIGLLLARAFLSGTHPGVAAPNAADPKREQ